MSFQLKIDFAGLIAFVSDTPDPDDAALWNTILVDPTMHGNMNGMEKHFPLLVAEQIAPANPPRGASVASNR